MSATFVKAGEMTATTYEPTVYCVDADNVLSSVSRSWLDFARENKAEELASQTIVGRPLLDFFAGDDLRCMFDLIMARVRQTGRPLTLPFRCDSPNLRRFMSLTITPLDEGYLEFKAEVLTGEKRDYVALLDPVMLRSDDWLTICSWCKRVEVLGDWLEAEDAVIRLQLFKAPALPRLTHGMCDDCAKTAMSELERNSA